MSDSLFWSWQPVKSYPTKDRKAETAMIDVPPLARLVLASWEYRDFNAECV